MTVSGEYDGWSASNSATAPLTTAELKDDPEPTKFEGPTRADGKSESIVKPGSRRLNTERPDATRSGLNQPSGVVGPTLLNVVIVSLAGLAWPPSSRAPTVMTSGSFPGDRMVPLSGPASPAETTTVMPAVHAFSTA